jgi:hypothetical protein
MMHRNSIPTLAIIICGLAFLSIRDVGAVPPLKSTFSNDLSQVLVVGVSDDPAVQLGLLSEEVLQGAESFFQETLSTLCFAARLQR